MTDLFLTAQGRCPPTMEIFKAVLYVGKHRINIKQSKFADRVSENTTKIKKQQKMLNTEHGFAGGGFCVQHLFLTIIKQ